MVEEFADATAWDCANNQRGKMAICTRGFIKADIMVRGGQQHFIFQQEPQVQVQAYLTSSMDTLTEQAEGMWCI
jgi:hypothetical protein